MKVRFYNQWRGNPTWAINFFDIYLILKGCPSFDIVILNFMFTLEWGKWTKNWKEKEGAIEDHQHGIA